MMHDLFLDALLLMILWLYAMLLWVWLRRYATASQADLKSAKRSTRPLQGPKPFPGLTTKPCCPACEHAPPPVPQHPSCPPPLRPSPRGRRRRVAAPQHYCLTLECDYYGWTGQGNLRANGIQVAAPNGSGTASFVVVTSSKAMGRFFMASVYRPSSWYGR
jgi:hypothetical protein